MYSFDMSKNIGKLLVSNKEKEEVLIIRIDKSLKAKLKTVSKQKKTTVSNLVRVILEDYLK